MYIYIYIYIRILGEPLCQDRVCVCVCVCVLGEPLCQDSVALIHLHSWGRRQDGLCAYVSRV